MQSTTIPSSRTLAVIGSRNFTDYHFMREKIQALLDRLSGMERIISGGAKGADSLSERIAMDFGLDHKHITAEWSKYGRAAGPLRSQKINLEADVAAAFPIGKSKGTHDGIRKAKAAGKQVFFFPS
jgi:hypothetical protein